MAGRFSHHGADYPIWSVTGRWDARLFDCEVIRKDDLELIMPAACPRDIYVPSYTCAPRETSFFRVPGGGFAAAENAEKRHGGAGL